MLQLRLKDSVLSSSYVLKRSFDSNNSVIFSQSTLRPRRCMHWIAFAVSSPSGRMPGPFHVITHQPTHRSWFLLLDELPTEANNTAILVQFGF